MTVVQFDVFDVDDPNGTPLGTIDDTEAEALDFRVGYRGDPGEGHILINRHHSAAALIAPDRIYKAKIPAIDSDYLYAFIQKDADYTLATPAEGGAESLELYGPGLKALFAQARLYWTVYAPGQTARGSRDRQHNLWWWINEPYGAIATRVIEEGINQPGAPLADMNVTFTRTHDSDGVPWANIADEWQTTVGTDVLSVLSEMEQHGDFYIEVLPDLTVNAYQTSPGRDLTASVHVQKGAELMTSLRRRIHGRPAIDRLILEDSDGNYSLETAPGASGRGNWGYYVAPTNDDTTLNKIGQEVIRASRTSLQPVEFEIDPLEYLPGPEGSTNGDYWTADTILGSTGTGPQDYDEEPFLVTGIRFSLDDAVVDTNATTRARSLRVVVECNVESVNGVDPQAGFGSVGCSCPNPALPPLPPVSATPIVDVEWTFDTDAFDVTHTYECQPSWGAVSQGHVYAGNLDTQASSPQSIPAVAGTTYTVYAEIFNRNLGANPAGVVLDLRFYNVGGTLLSSTQIGAAQVSGGAVSDSVVAPAGTVKMGWVMPQGSCGNQYTIITHGGSGAMDAVPGKPTDYPPAPFGLGEWGTSLRYVPADTVYPVPRASTIPIDDDAEDFTGETVEEALAELATEPAAGAHVADTTDAHDASAISIVDAGGYFTGTQVEAALQELGADVAAVSAAVGHYEVIVSGTAPPVAVTNIAEDDWIYGFVAD